MSEIVTNWQPHLDEGEVRELAPGWELRVYYRKGFGFRASLFGRELPLTRSTASAARDYAEEAASKLFETVQIALNLNGEIPETLPTQAEPPLERGFLEMDSVRHRCSWKGNEIKLTRIEFNLVHALAERPGQVKSRDQLIQSAHPDDIDVDNRVIDSHIKRIRIKFRKADPDFAQIGILYGVGYRWQS